MKQLTECNSGCGNTEIDPLPPISYWISDIYDSWHRHPHSGKHNRSGALSLSEDVRSVRIPANLNPTREFEDRALHSGSKFEYYPCFIGRTTQRKSTVRSEIVWNVSHGSHIYYRSKKRDTIGSESHGTGILQETQNQFIRCPWSSSDPPGGKIKSW
jgi:hypothetical protein